MVKKIKSHKDVKLPFGSGKTDTRPWVPRPPVPKAKGEGGVPSEKWDDPSKKKGPFVPAPKPKLARSKKTNSVNA